MKTNITPNFSIMGCELVLTPRNPVLELSLGENKVNCCHGKQVRKGEQIHNNEGWGHSKETAMVDRYWSPSLVRSAAAGWRRKAYCSSWEGAGGSLFSVTPGADGPELVFVCYLAQRRLAHGGEEAMFPSCTAPNLCFLLKSQQSDSTQHYPQLLCDCTAPWSMCHLILEAKPCWWKCRSPAMVCFVLLVNLLHASE